MYARVVVAPNFTLLGEHLHAQLRDLEHSMR